MHKTMDHRLAQINDFISKAISGDEVEFLESGNDQDVVSLLTEGLNILVRELREREHQIAAQKKAQEKEAEKFNQLKKQFLMHMSHELRTPLNAIIGAVDILDRESNLSKTQEETLSVLHRSSHELSRVVTDILDLSKLESGELKPEIKEVHLRQVIIETRDLYRKRAQQKGLSTKLYFADDIPATIGADGARVAQMLSRLLENSIAFSEKGTIEISTSLRKKSKNKLTIQVEVKDAGAGVPDHLIDSIFDYFDKPDYCEALKSNRGSGLNLNLVKKIAKSHGGGVGHTYSRENGSVFWFSFTANIPGKKKSKVATKKSYKKYDLHVLLVDDNELNLFVEGKILELLGCTYEKAENGIKAIEKYRTGVFDLILMDIQMPEMDGIQATSIIKKEFKKTPPIIAVSANASGEIKDDPKKYGLDAYLVKPLDLEELLKVLDNWFR